MNLLQFMKRLHLFFAFLLLVCPHAIAQKESYTFDDLYRLALESALESKNEEALLYLSKAKTLNPTSSDVYAMSGSISFGLIKELWDKQLVSRDSIVQMIPECLSDLNNSILYWNNESSCSLSLLLYNRADFYAFIGHYQNSYNDIQEAYRSLQKDEYDVAIDVLLARAEYYEALEEEKKYQADMNEALEYCKKGIKSDPKKPDYYSKRMNIYYRLGNYKLLIESIIDGLVKFPIEQYEEIDGYEKALMSDIAYCKKLIDKKLKKDPNNPAWLYIQALISFYNRDYVLALQQYDAMINKVGPAYRLYHAKFLCYHDTRCYDKGMAVLEKMEQLYDSIDVDDTFYKMQLHVMKGEHEKVVEIADYLLNTFGYNAGVLLNRAYSYQAMNQDAKAMVDLNTVIANEPTNVRAYLRRSRLHRKYGATEMAKLDDEMVLKYDTICDGSSVRHYSLYFLGQEDEAIKWVDDIVEGSPKSISCHYDRACLMSLMGKTDEALKSLRLAMELGFGDFVHLMHDEDLNNLRQLPEFIELVSKYQQVHDDFCSELVAP